jgi:hypothetical protein
MVVYEELYTKLMNVTYKWVIMEETRHGMK